MRMNAESFKPSDFAAALISAYSSGVSRTSTRDPLVWSIWYTPVFLLAPYGERLYGARANHGRDDMSEQTKDGGHARLPTLGLCAIVDGRLMGDIGDVYEVISHFIGRPAYTHELPKYGRIAAPAIAAMYPDMAGRDAEPWQEVRDAMLARHGASVDVPEDWAGSLDDNRGPLENLTAMLADRCQS